MQFVSCIFSLSEACWYKLLNQFVQLTFGSRTTVCCWNGCWRCRLWRVCLRGVPGACRSRWAVARGFAGRVPATKRALRLDRCRMCHWCNADNGNLSCRMETERSRGTAEPGCTTANNRDDTRSAWRKKDTYLGAVYVKLQSELFQKLFQELQPIFHTPAHL